jgi:dipeptide/tripeptide permease
MRAKLPLWLAANGLLRLSFFLFKYVGVFYLAFIIGSEREARLRFSWFFGLAYLLPVLWSARINTTRAQISAVWFGSFFLFVSFLAFAAQREPFVGGILFSLGFGLINSNFKAIFAAEVKASGQAESVAFTLLLFSTNAAAALAGFIAAKPVERGLQSLSTLFLFCAAGVLLFGVIWFYLSPSRTQKIVARDLPKITSHPASAKAQVLVVGCVIALVTLFWICFELRPMTLNQLAKERLASTTWGLHITATHLQSVNPIAYLILSPLFAIILAKLDKRAPHDLTFMAWGIVLTGLGLLFFSYTVENTHSQPIGAQIFILLYLVQTAAEILIEPIGLSFIVNNSTTRFRTISLVLWESNSGIAYLLGGLVSNAGLRSLGYGVFFGGLTFVLLLPLLRRYVK